MRKLIFLFLLSLLPQAFAESCDGLAVHSSFRRDHDYKTTLTDIREKYSLYRESDDTYEILVNLRFVGSMTHIQRAMKEKVAVCLETKSLVYSKKSGTTIKFKLYDPTTDNQKLPEPPPEVTIRITLSRSRANSNSYPMDIDCSTVTHEVLHLTGLVDEYFEEKDNRPLYPGRAISPDNSVMAFNGTSFLGISTSKGKLYPAHIRHILYPGCQERNSVYYTCAKDAYKTDPNVPKAEECTKKSWLQ